MANAPPDFACWLRAARTGCQDALGRLLELSRGYLLLVAERELAPDLRAKGGASDLVQETLLEAVRDFGRFQGDTEAELLAWLRRLLLNNVISFTRLYRETAKRQVGREVALEGDGSASRCGLEPCAGGDSPSDLLVQAEDAESIRRAVARLPEDYRRALQLRYGEGWTFEEIGAQLGLTANAATKLCLRAVKRLQQETEGPP
jgi:RNA polymerase sigma-70 factor (ECF subfamily)